MSIEKLVKQAYERGATDLHMESGLPPALRLKGNIEFLEDPINPTQFREWLVKLLGPERWEYLEINKSVDLSEFISGIRCRINVYYSYRGFSLSLRLLEDRQLSIDSINLHPVFKTIVRQDHGLILVCGPTGSGKSTTLAAMVDEINSSKKCNIITIENPIEYVMKSKRSFVHQREVGVSVAGFSEGVRDALREDPDVILVGEVRDEETAKATLNAAETGHLVLATIHSSNVTEAITRLSSTFNKEFRQQALSQLAGCLRAVICQRLVYLEDQKIRVPKCEILISNTAVKSMLQSDTLRGIPDALRGGRDVGSMTLDWYQEWLDKKTAFTKPDKRKTLPSQPQSEVINREAWKVATRTTKRKKQIVESNSDYEIDDSDDLNDIIGELEKD